MSYPKGYYLTVSEKKFLIFKNLSLNLIISSEVQANDKNSKTLRMPAGKISYMFILYSLIFIDSCITCLIFFKVTNSAYKTVMLKQHSSGHFVSYSVILILIIIKKKI